MRTFDDTAPALFALSYRVSFRLCGQRSEADDIAQETVARAAVRWGRVESFAEAWSAKVATNLTFDFLACQRRLGTQTGEVVADRGGQSDRIDLARALRALPRRQREVIVLRYLADLTELDVADRLGCSVGAVKQHAHRALATLRASTHLTLAEGI